MRSKQHLTLSLALAAAFFAGCKTTDEVVSSPKPAVQITDLKLCEIDPDAATIPSEVEVDNSCPVARDIKKEAEKTPTPDVVFVPTPQDVVDKMLELAKVEKDDLIYDLGCGDGRIVVTAANRYGCKAVGYDIDPERVKESLDNVKNSNVGHLVTIEQKDIFTLDLSKANVITLYLLPSLNVKLIPQLEKLRPGSRIVSHDFRMRGVKPDKVLRLTSNEDQSEHKIYLWTSPLKKRVKKNKPATVENSLFDDRDQQKTPGVHRC
jgi:SAM-dependent methyltransferase